MTQEMVTDGTTTRRVKVPEVTVAIQGPAAGLYLAEMGADVTKIEPSAGDCNRYHRGNDYDVPDSAPGS